jgi:hypothetical protein
MQLVGSLACCLGPMVAVRYACCQLPHHQIEEHVCLQLQSQLPTDSTLGLLHLAMSNKNKQDYEA